MRWKGPVGFVGDPVDLGVDPGDQLPESGRIVRESGRSPLEPGVGVEPVLGDADPDGVKDAHLPFSCACHASLDAHVSIQDVGKDGGDHTPVRPLTAKRPAVRPPSLFGARSGSLRSPPWVPNSLGLPGDPNLQTKRTYLRMQ